MMYMPSLFRENLVDDFFNDFDHSFFTRPVRGKEAVRVMKTDVRETKEGFELDVELPGYKKDSITLELNEGNLTITAKKQENTEEKDQQGRLIRQERYAGTMQRTFYVGEDITEEDVKAKFEDGILKLFVPKKEAVPKVPEKKYIAIEG